MEYLGLIFEFFLLGLGVYLYLFSVGKFKTHDQTLQKRSDEFRKSNSTWLRIGSLALIAMMLINIVIHLSQLFNKV